MQKILSPFLTHRFARHRFCKNSQNQVMQTGKKVLRRPTFKDAAKMVLQRERHKSVTATTANGLRPEVKSAIKKSQADAETVKGELCDVLAASHIVSKITYAIIYSTSFARRSLF